MKRLMLLIFVVSLSVILCLQTPAVINTNDEILATINGENIYLSEFNRLFNAQKKQYEKELDFNLFSKITNKETISKRESELNKAKNEFNVTDEEINSSWDTLIFKSGNLENLEIKAKENNLTIEEIKNKLKENLVLEKYFKKIGREKLVELMLNEMIFLQEAKARDLKISEEDINKKINFIKQREGGDEALEKFLQENNATIEDAKKEIKNQLISKFIKAILQSENVNLKTFLTEKKEKANIIVYNDKIKDLDLIAPSSPESTTTTTTLRTKEYPIISKSKVEEILKLEEKTNEILQRTEEVPLLSAKQQEELEKQFKKREKLAIEETIQKDGIETSEIKTQLPEIQSFNEISQNKETIELSKINEPQIIEPINKPKGKRKHNLKKLFNRLNNSAQGFKDKLNKIKLSKREKNKETEISESLVPGEEITLDEGLVVGIPKTPNKEFEVKKIKPQSVDINTLNVLKNYGGLQGIQTKDTLSKELEELRRKIEERRVTIKE